MLAQAWSTVTQRRQSSFCTKHACSRYASVHLCIMADGRSRRGNAGSRDRRREDAGMQSCCRGAAAERRTRLILSHGKCRELRDRGCSEMCAKCAPPRRSALKRKVLVRWGGPRGAVARCDAPSQGRRWGRPAAGESYETGTFKQATKVQPT